MSKQEVKVTGMFFMPSMVKAVVEGRKFETRRPIKQQPTPVGNRWRWPVSDIPVGSGTYSDQTIREVLARHCPYGQRGDVIWPREPYRIIGFNSEEETVTVEYKSDIKGRRVRTIRQVPFSELPAAGLDGERWLCFLPRRFARFFARIEEVTAEPLQEMLLRDVMNEGLISPFEPGLKDVDECEFCGCTEKRACKGGCFWIRPGRCSSCATNRHSPDHPIIKIFARGWDRMHRQSFYFADNPWVWVVRFHRLDRRY